MSICNASNILDIDLFEDASSKYSGNASQRGGGAEKAIPDVRAARDTGTAAVNIGKTVNRIKQAIKDDNLAPRSNRRLLEKAIHVIKDHLKAVLSSCH